MIFRIAQNLLTVSWYSFVVLVVMFGWTLREQRYLVAETGIGYWLGIFGGLMMLMLLIYPLRKRKPRWHFLGSVKFWFRFHMLLGVVGPVLIIFHSGYRLGSLNGQVAFFSMLIVAASGLIGRYLYRRIHHGLYGEKIRFDELYQENQNWDEILRRISSSQPQISDSINQLQSRLAGRDMSNNRSFWFYRSSRSQLKKLRARVRKQVPDSDDKGIILEKINSLYQICNLGINEILFSYWHVFHLPLFFMLVLSGFIHVTVVHFY